MENALPQQLDSIRRISCTLGLNGLNVAANLPQRFFDWLNTGNPIYAARRLQAAEAFPVSVYYLFENAAVRTAIDDGSPLIPIITTAINDHSKDLPPVTEAAVRRLQTQRSLPPLALYRDSSGAKVELSQIYANSIATLPTDPNLLPSTDDEWAAYYGIWKQCQERKGALQSLSLTDSDVMLICANNWRKSGDALEKYNIGTVGHAHSNHIAIDIALPFAFRLCGREVGGKLSVHQALELVDDIIKALNKCFKEKKMGFWKRYEYVDRVSLNYPKIAAQLFQYDRTQSIPDLVETWPDWHDHIDRRIGDIEVHALNSRTLLREDGEAHEFCVAIYAPQCILKQRALYSLRDANTGRRLSTVCVFPNGNNTHFATKNARPDPVCVDVGNKVAAMVTRTLFVGGPWRDHWPFEQVYGFRHDNIERAQFAFRAFTDLHTLPYVEGGMDVHSWLGHIGFEKYFSETKPLPPVPKGGFSRKVSNLLMGSGMR